MRRISFTKGHGTLNDFVLVLDRHNAISLEPHDVARLCDRRAGIGADGVLRVVRAKHIPEWDGDPDLWFMDYRNADGSVAQMCGNGIRVLAAFLLSEDLVPGPEMTIATRAGAKRAVVGRHGVVTTEIGRVEVSGQVTIDLDGRSWSATRVDLGNPHAVVMLESGESLDELDLSHQPTWTPTSAFPEGVNVEFAQTEAPGSLRMRVHERGAGETLSCGTGAVAVAAAHAAAHAVPESHVEVHLPGGRLVVELHEESARLTGPTELVANGEFWLDEDQP